MSVDTVGWTAAKTAAWMAFAKGLCVMGNTDAGEHRATFESWWQNYGKLDAAKVVEAVRSEVTP